MPADRLPRMAPLALPALCGLILVGAGWTALGRSQGGLCSALSSAGLVLLLGALALTARKAAAPRCELRILPAHWVQACVQLLIFMYWGAHWAPVRGHAPLIGLQILFAYGFGMLLAWWRGQSYALGFGPLPIVLSTNLFLWFKADFFAWQFAMIAAGALGKELLRWPGAGRGGHIFNPSALSLSLFSIGLLATGHTDATYGAEIASTLIHAPHMYLLIFAVGLLVQGLFHVTLTTLGAALMLLLLNLAYTGGTGVYWFLDANIPIAVFLGLHLLVTDPSTSPRTTVGRILFGAAYGAGVFATYGLLASRGLPAFYDKLLCVPLLNLCVPLFDGAARSRAFAWLTPKALELGAPRANLLHMLIWIALFSGMHWTGFVGSSHPGDRVDFWRAAAAEGRRHGLRNLVHILQVQADEGQPAAGNELGTLLIEGRHLPPDPARAARAFAAAGDAGHRGATRNLVMLELFHGGAPHAEGALERAFERLAAEASSDPLACYLLGFAHANGRGRERDPQRALDYYEEGCAQGDARCCKEAAKLALLMGR